VTVLLLLVPFAAVPLGGISVFRGPSIPYIMQIVGCNAEPRAESPAGKTQETPTVDVEVQTIALQKKLSLRERLFKDGKPTPSFWVALMRECGQNSRT
jgi:hypothetical protein